MYLDPGFGSMLIQYGIAALAACAGVLFLIKNKIKLFFAARKAKKNGVVPAEADTADQPETADCVPAATEAAPSAAPAEPSGPAHAKEA